MIIWILLAFYVFLMFVYLLSTESKPSFDKLNIRFNRYLPNSNCATDSDCNNQEKCLQNKCYPTYRGTNLCNAITGQWILENINGKYFVKCTCLYPHLITQKFVGANCDVDIACSPYGQLQTKFINHASEAKCNCMKGYKSLTPPLVGCVKMLPIERNKTICDLDEISITDAPKIFHLEYIRNLSAPVRCLKNPCLFNIFNGKPLTNAVFDKKYGCICNPKYGNFGIKLDNMNKYLLTEGYDACANIFQNTSPTEFQVKLFTYFYINGEKPISFIQFSNLKKEYLIPELQDLLNQNDNALQIEELWPYNYSQYIFERENFTVHTRECIYETFLHIEKCHERLMKQKQMIDCDKIRDQVPALVNYHMQTYSLLYKYPVCKYKSSAMADIYKDHYILNPHLLSHKDYNQLLRSNGIEIVYDGKWIVSLAPADFVKYENTSVFPRLKELTLPTRRNLFNYTL